MALEKINITKIERMILVKDTVDRLQRASLEDVLISFCAKTGLSQSTKNLKQYIRRDLESLCVDANYLNKDYFLPNKDKLEPGEEELHKNVRVEYSVIRESSEILGVGILEQANGRIITPGRDYIQWKLSNLSDSFDDNSLSFSMKLTQAGFISLSIKKDELPFKLIIGKNSFNKVPSLQEISTTFGQRIAMLLLNEGGIEESISNSKFGHSLIEFGTDPHTCKVQDLGSKNGTYTALVSTNQILKPTEDNLFNEILYMANNDIEEVIMLKPEPLSLDREWSQVFNIPSGSQIPLLIRCGRFIFYISII